MSGAQARALQPDLPAGPTHVAGRGGLNNREFWRSVNAVQFTSKGAGRTAVYRAVAYFASFNKARECYAAIETIAKRADMGATAARAQVQALERDGFIGWLASTGVSLEVQRAMAKQQRQQQHDAPAEKVVPAPAAQPPAEQGEGVAPAAKPEADIGCVLEEAFTGPDMFDPGAAFLPGTPKSNSLKVISALRLVGKPRVERWDPKVERWGTA